MGEDVSLKIEHNGAVKDIFMPKDDLKELGERTLQFFPKK